MDRHIVPGIEAENAAEAHREDLRIQDKFGCRCMTYWVDEERGSAFCLIDGPDEESVRKMHDKAHGLIPHEIIRVNSNVVEAFLGRIHDPEGYYGLDPDLKIFNDPAFRTILVTSAQDSRLLQNEFGMEKASKLLGIYTKTFKSAVNEHEGRQVELGGGSSVASFVSVSQAVKCALAIQEGLHVAGELISLRVGLSAGMPVSKSRFIFGNTIRMARVLGQLARGSCIGVGTMVRELYKTGGAPQGQEKDFFKYLDPAHEDFLELLLDSVETSYMLPEFGVAQLCKNLSMSKSKLYRECVAVLGVSPNRYLREYRLQKSLEYLKSGRNVSEVAFDAGFNGASYFTKCFQKRFGVLPLYYQKELDLV